jgi:hypothetical protein
MASTASGVTIPGTDPSSTPATPIQDHWNNLGKSLNGRIVVPVASTTARAALVAALAAEGFTPSAANPLYDHRSDATAGNELEVTTDGATWRTIPTLADTGWVAPALLNSWSNFSPGSYDVAAYRRINGIVFIKGTIAGGLVGPSPIFVLPAGFRPLLVRTSTQPSTSGTAVVAVSEVGSVFVAAYGTAGNNTNLSLGQSFPAEQ